MINFYCYILSFTLSLSHSHTAWVYLLSWLLVSVVSFFCPFLNGLWGWWQFVFGGKLFFPHLYIVWLGFIVDFFSHTCTHEHTEGGRESEKKQNTTLNSELIFPINSHHHHPPIQMYTHTVTAYRQWGNIYTKE